MSYQFSLRAFSREKPMDRESEQVFYSNKQLWAEKEEIINTIKRVLDAFERYEFPELKLVIFVTKNEGEICR